MKNIALFERLGRQDAIECAEATAKAFVSHGAQCYAEPALIERFTDQIKKNIKICSKEEFEKFADMAVSFGGDGTILGIARVLLRSDIPIMGFNVGKLGFLAEYTINDIDKSVNDIMNGRYRVVNRSALESQVDNETIFALNDFVIEKTSSSHMISFDGFANRHFIGSFRADGLIITTPTGSTAYNLSVGGPIIAPSAEVVCICPIAPHSLTLRPLVMPDSNEITLKVQSLTGEAQFVADGQIVRKLKNNDTVSIRKSDAKIKLIKPLESSYYDILRNKLLWSVNTIGNDIKKTER